MKLIRLNIKYKNPETPQSGDNKLNLYKSPVKLHSEYEVMNEKKQNVGIDILLLCYGSRWKYALDMLDNQIDGHLHAIYHEGNKYKIYRKTKDNKKRHLRLVK